MQKSTTTESRKSFVFYRDWFESLQPLNEADKLRMYQAICNYALNGKVPKKCDLAFNLIKATIDRDCQKWASTQKSRSEAGKRHTGNQYTRKNQMEQMEQTEHNVNVNVNVNENENENENVDVNTKGHSSSSIDADDMPQQVEEYPTEEIWTSFCYKYINKSGYRIPEYLEEDDREIVIGWMKDKVSKIYRSIDEIGWIDDQHEPIHNWKAYARTSLHTYLKNLTREEIDFQLGYE